MTDKEKVMHLIDASYLEEQEPQTQELELAPRSNLNKSLEIAFRNARAESYSRSVALKATYKRITLAAAIVVVVAFLIADRIPLPQPSHIISAIIAEVEEPINTPEDISYIRYGYMENSGEARLNGSDKIVQVSSLFEDGYHATPGDNVEIGFNYLNEPVSCNLRQ